MTGLTGGWRVTSIVDDDGHLVVEIQNTLCDTIGETDTELFSSNGEGIVLRFTTPKIEKERQ